MDIARRLIQAASTRKFARSLIEGKLPKNFLLRFDRLLPSFREIRRVDWLDTATFEVIEVSNVFCQLAMHR